MSLTLKLSCHHASAQPTKTMSYAGFYGKTKDIDLAESEKVLRAALDTGMRLVNTADFYTGFEAGDEVSGNIKLLGQSSHFSCSFNIHMRAH